MQTEPKSIAEIKTNLKDNTLCAVCPQSLWEAVWEKSNTEPDMLITQAITPVDKLGSLHIACYCTVKGRYVPGYIYLCQSYDDAIKEQAATRLDQKRERA